MAIKRFGMQQPHVQCFIQWQSCLLHSDKKVIAHSKNPYLQHCIDMNQKYWRALDFEEFFLDI